MANPYKVIAYRGEIQSLLSELEKSGILNKRAMSNIHFHYLDEYFRGLNVQTVLIEQGYIDKDYLEDYSRYYAKCFQEYSKRCVRSRSHFSAVPV